IDESQPMTFRAVFETLPFVEVPTYKGLQAKVRAPQVTEEQIVAELDRLREEAALDDAVEGRASQRGDFLVLDVAYTTAGGESRQDQNVLVEVGGSDNHPDLNAVLEGLVPGDAREVRLTYEASHPSPRLAGQTVDYQVSVKAIK